MPSSAISIATPRSVRHTRTEAVVAAAYFATFASASHATKYSAISTASGSASGRSQDTSVGTAERPASESSAAGRPWSRTAGWMPRASSRSSASDSRELVARGHDERLGGGGVGVDLGPHEPELDAERDEALLRAVVQVTLEPPALGVARCDDALPRGPQLR